MKWFFLIQAVITGATALVLTVAPDAIPASFGLKLTSDAHLLCYFYAATEVSLIYLSSVGMRVGEGQTRRLLYGYFLFVHAVEGTAGLFAIAQGLPTKVWANSGAHFFIAVVFAFAVFKRIPDHRVSYDPAHAK